MSHGNAIDNSSRINLVYFTINRVYFHDMNTLGTMVFQFSHA